MVIILDFFMREEEEMHLGMVLSSLTGSVTSWMGEKFINAVLLIVC